MLKRSDLVTRPAEHKRSIYGAARASAAEIWQGIIDAQEYVDELRKGNGTIAHDETETRRLAGCEENSAFDTTPNNLLH